MPRLLLSSLPADLTTTHLKDFLSRPPAGVTPPATLDHVTPRPTDVKVLMTKQGRSRRMAFVGYKNDLEANWVKDVWQGVWVNGTTGHASGSRIDVEWAKSVEESSAETKSGKRGHPSGSQAVNQSSSKRQRPTEEEQNPEFQAFLSTMQPRQHKSLVEDILEVPTTAPVPSSHSPSNSVVNVRTKKSDRSATEPCNPPDPSLQPPTPPIDSAPEAPPVIGDEEDITDKEYMARRMKRTIGSVLPSDPPSSLPAQPTNKDWDQDVPQPTSPTNEGVPPTLTGMPQGADGSGTQDDTDEVCIMQSGRLFLRNLPFSVTEDDLRSLFSPLGVISQVHIPVDQDRRPKGVAYVTFTRPSDALVAFRQLDQHDFQGRLLHILPAVTRNMRPELDSGRGSKNIVKQEKDNKRKLESSKQFNWGSLYMNSDAVATSIADRLKISKAELYDPDAQNPSIKLALAETHIITETKQYFEEQGIDTEAFSLAKVTRSSTTLLVKNIPYGTSESTLRTLFAQHGEVSRVLLPPSGTISLIEMVNPEEARSAFKFLAYKRIGNSVLYLEKAPDGIWKKTAPRPSNVLDTATGPTAAVAPPSTEPVPAIDQGEPGSTLFIKNLAFSTTTDGLSSAFRTLPNFLFARIQTKPDPKNAGHRLSMGFGFVGFKTVEAAQHAIKAMQRFQLDGHALEIKFANRGKDDEERESKPATATSETISSSKLLIKNVPFETSKKELRELFESYGKLKSVRLPKKLDRKTRGFGFVEFSTKKEAEEAMRALKHTHILGRHLVISYANDQDEDVEQLRAKSGGNFLTNKVTLQKTKFQGLKGGNDVEEAMEED